MLHGELHPSLRKNSSSIALTPTCTRDYTIAARACHSCARLLYPFSTERQSHRKLTIARTESLGDDPLLSKFNLQGYFSHVWDDEDLSRILVCLVEACDKRDFKPVIESLLACNEARRFDVYRTILYLAKYQCTTAFHAFFPATVKPCKGYHFWVSASQIAYHSLTCRLTYDISAQLSRFQSSTVFFETDWNGFNPPRNRAHHP